MNKLFSKYHPCLILGAKHALYIGKYKGKIVLEDIRSEDDLASLINRYKLISISIAIDYDCVNYSKKLLPKLSNIEFQYMLRHLSSSSEKRAICTGSINSSEQSHQAIYKIICDDNLLKWIRILHKNNCYIKDFFPIVLLQQHLFQVRDNIYLISKGVDKNIRHVFIKNGVIEFTRYTQEKNLADFIESTVRYIQSNYGISIQNIKQVSTFNIACDDAEKIRIIDSDKINKLFRINISEFSDNDRLNIMALIKHQYRYVSVMNLKLIDDNIGNCNKYILINRYVNIANRCMVVGLFIQLLTTLYYSAFGGLLEKIFGWRYGA